MHVAVRVEARWACKTKVSRAGEEAFREGWSCDGWLLDATHGVLIVPRQLIF